MPKNTFSVWSEVVDYRSHKSQEKFELTDADIAIIERLFKGESAGIHLHKLKNTYPPIYSAYVNEKRRLLFIVKGSTLALIDILENHNYQDIQPGIAERFFQKAWDEILASGIEFETIVSLKDFIPTQDYCYQPPKPCVSYHQKFITLDDTQLGTLNLPTPAVIIGDPGCGKSSLCSVMMERDCHNPALLDENKLIIYFSESAGLSEKMQPAWMLDYPLTARQPAAEQLKFLNYTQLLLQFGPPEIQGKTPVGEREFQAMISKRLSDKNVCKQFPFINTREFKLLTPTLYHEFQMISVCRDQEDYLRPEKKTNLPLTMRPWAYAEHQRYLKNLSVEGKHYDPNFLLWQPTYQPFSRVYHDEALSASPAINIMLHRLTKDANIIFFADPNQENTKQVSDLEFIISELGVNRKPATKQSLSVTYRLPPTIASLANELLVIKQNLNGGKNEKNQSSQIHFIDDEVTEKGTLEWHTLDKAKVLIDRLNSSNQVYVVITHAEYIDEAKALFGERVCVLTTEEARGQEFESVVLYRMTDPKPKFRKIQQGKQKQTLLQQVGKALSELETELKSKPNLAKAGKVNRAFEPYMNSLYIAVTRIQSHGYLIESNDSITNGLHDRMRKCIESNMKQVANEDLNTLAVTDILTKAKQDLAEGKIMQAKAGFLRAGQSETEFEAALMAKRQADEAQVNRILDDRTKSAPKQAYTPETIPPLNTQDRKTLNEILIKDNKQRLITTLRKMSNLNQLRNNHDLVNHQPSNYLQCILHSKKLRETLLNHLTYHKEAAVSLFSGIDFNTKALTSDKVGDKCTAPLIVSMAESTPGQIILETLASNPTNAGLFSGILFETFNTNLKTSNTHKLTLIQYAAKYSPHLFIRLVNENIHSIKGVSAILWFKDSEKMNPSDPVANPIACAIAQCLSAKGSLQLKLLECLENLIKLFCDSPDKDVVAQLIIDAAKNSVFDLMLPHREFKPIIEILLNHFSWLMPAKFLLELSDQLNPCITRIEAIITIHGQKSVAKSILENLIVPPEFEGVYAKVIAQYYPEKAKTSIAAPSGLEPTPIKPKYLDIILRILNDKTKTMGLIIASTSRDGAIQIPLISLLEDENTKKALYHVLMSENSLYVVEKYNFKALLLSISLCQMASYIIGDETIHRIPIWHILLDRHHDIMSPYAHLLFHDSRHKKDQAQLYIENYSSTFNESIKLITLAVIVNPILLVEALKSFPDSFNHINWNTVYFNGDEMPCSALMSVSNHGASDTFNEILSTLHKRLKIFESSVDLKSLFYEFKEWHIAGFTHFDMILETKHGSKILSLLLKKIISNAAFSEFISVDFLTKPIKSTKLITHQGRALTPNRLNALGNYPLLEPILNRALDNIIHASQLAIQGSINVLKANLSQPKLYPFFIVAYRRVSIIDRIICSEPLRTAMFSFFKSRIKNGTYHSFNEFIDVVDLNRIVISTDKSERPFIHTLFNDPNGKYILRHFIHYDPREFIQRIKVSTLSSEIAFKLNGKEQSQPFIIPFMLSNIRTLLSALRYCQYLPTVLESIFQKNPPKHWVTPDKLIELITDQIVSEKFEITFAEPIVESLALLFESMPSLTRPDEGEKALLFGPKKREKVLFDRIKALASVKLITRLITSLWQNEDLQLRLVEDYKLKLPKEPTLDYIRSLMTFGIDKDQRHLYREMLDNSDEVRLDELLNNINTTTILSLPLDDRRPLLVHLLENPVLSEKLIKHISLAIDKDLSNDYANLFSKKILTTYITHCNHKKPILFMLMESNDGRRLIESLEEQDIRLYSKTDAKTYTKWYYSNTYGKDISLCYIFALESINSLNLLLTYNPSVLDAVSHIFWLKTYSINGRTTSILSSLLFTAYADDYRSSKLLNLIFDHNDGKLLKQSGNLPWFEKNIICDESQPEPFSLFDLLLLKTQKTAARDIPHDTLIFITKKVMNSNFNHFLKTYFSETNLFSDFIIPGIVTTRAAMMLSHPDFHPSFSIYLRQPQVSYSQLAKILNVDGHSSPGSVISSENLIIRLSNTKSGCQLLQAFSKIPALMELLNPVLREIIETAMRALSNPALPSVATQGLFSGNPPPMSADNAINYIKTHYLDI